MSATWKDREGGSKASSGMEAIFPSRRWRRKGQQRSTVSSITDPELEPRRYRNAREHSAANSIIDQEQETQVSQPTYQDDTTVKTYEAQEAMKTIDAIAKRQGISRREVLMFSDISRSGKDDDDQTIETVATESSGEGTNKNFMERIMENMFFNYNDSEDGDTAIYTYGENGDETVISTVIDSTVADSTWVDSAIVDSSYVDTAADSTNVRGSTFVDTVLDTVDEGTVLHSINERRTTGESPKQVRFAPNKENGTEDTIFFCSRKKFNMPRLGSLCAGSDGFCCNHTEEEMQLSDSDSRSEGSAGSLTDEEPKITSKTERSAANDSSASVTENSQISLSLQSGYGNEYVGQVNAGTSKEGKGTFKCKKTGVEYNGTFRKGTMDGWGTCVYSSGSVYEGEWKGGKRDGLGMFRFVNGDVYQGSFRDGKRDGLGSYVYADGGMYQGHFRNNLREGKGRYRFTNGDSYEGEYKYDTRHGKGTYTSANGNVYKGMWQNDQRQGPGKFKWADGALFAGTWSNNVKHGLGKYHTADGKKFDEKWKNGLLIYRVEAKDQELL